MPKLKVLSGSELVSIFARFGFAVYSQRGGHVKLRRVVLGLSQTLTIPNHKELARGTLKSIYTQALRYISENEVHSHFYTE